MRPVGTLAFDASAEHAGWEGAADAIYLPEPHAPLMQLCRLLSRALLQLRAKHT